MKKDDNKKIFNQKLKTIAPYAIAAVFVALPSLGFCAGEDAEINTATQSALGIIFSPWAKKIVLGFAAVGGGLKAFAAGSAMPLVTWGGLGLIYNFIPKFLEFLTKI